MKRLRTIPLVLLLVMVAAALRAQSSATSDAAVERELERLRSSIGDDGEQDADLEELLWLRDNPIDLCESDAEELARLPGIDVQTAIAIVAAVRHTQPRDLNALRTHVALSPRQITMLRGFTTLSHDDSDRALRGSLRMRVERETSMRRGYSDQLRRIIMDSSGLPVDTVSAGTAYRGRPEAIVSQFTVESRNVAIAATFASDRGEPIIYRDTSSYRYVRDERVALTEPVVVGGQRLAAHASASMEWRRRGIAIIIGDYTAEFGQGLAIADRRRRFSRSSGASAPHVNARRLSPYRSTDETAFLRGIALEVELERPLPFRVRGAAFASWRWLDTSIDSTRDHSGTATPIVTSIRRDGNRRTVSEIRRSLNALERTVGANASCEHERWSIGASLLRTSLQPSRTTDNANTTTWSVDARASTRRVSAYAECAGHGADFAVVAGALGSLGRASVVVAIRSLSDGIDLPHGRAFPNASSPNPEHGVFVGLEMQLAPSIGMTVALDAFTRPAGRSTAHVPHNGSDARIAFRWEPSSDVALDVRVDHAMRAERSSLTDHLGRTHRGVADHRRSRASAILSLMLRPLPLQLRMRLDACVAGRTDSTLSQGALSVVDVRFDPFATLGLRAGLAIFTVDDADASLYIVEAGIAGRFNSVRASGRGSRLFAAVQWEPVHALRLSLAYGGTSYTDRRTIGSGSDEISEDYGGMVALQAEWRFAGGRR